MYTAVEPTSDGQTCKLPYQLFFNNSTQTTSWNMWFCYNNQCPKQNHLEATCSSGTHFLIIDVYIVFVGSYGLISLHPFETSKTIIHPLNATKNQCLRFYYYFTIYDNQSDWGQQIQVWNRPNNQTNHRFLLTNLTVMNMRENRWEHHEVTFSLTSDNYTVSDFEEEEKFLFCLFSWSLCLK